MNFFAKLFGKKQPGPPSTQEALQKLMETEDLILKKQEYLEKRISAEVQIAKTQGVKNKRLALQALKRKKNYEKQLEHIDGVLNTIQHQKNSLENATMNSDVLQVISSSSKALKKAHNEMDVDKVHDLMEDIAEQQDLAIEVANAISNPVGLQSDIDEDDLMRELQQLEEEDLSKQMLNIGITPTDAISQKLPLVPMLQLPENGVKTSTTTKKKQEDDELAELEAWANS